MKKFILILIVLFLAQYSLACSVDEIIVNETSKRNYEITVITNNCTTEKLYLFGRDLMTLADETIYYGDITSSEMKFNWENYVPGIKKIYAEIEEESYFTILEAPVPTDEIIAKAENQWQNPRVIEYNKFKIKILTGIAFSSVNLKDQKFGFYFENQDFNILWENPVYLKESFQLENYPNRSHYYIIDLNNDNSIEIMDVNITKLKYNDKLIIFAGTPDKNAYQIIDINSMPFTTIKEINFDYDTNNLTVNFDVYNAHDVNYCSLLLDSNNVQTINNLQEENNYFEQIISQNNQLIDINCVTDGNHYLISTNSGNVSTTPYPEIDNVPFLSDNPKSIEIVWPFVKNDLNYLEILTCDQLNYVSNYPDNNFSLKNNLYCEGIEVTPINDFNGVFDGNGKTIYNLEINLDENNVGLFSHLFGTIKNLGIADANISANNIVGIVAGINDGNIKSVYVTGQINAKNNAGGIVGVNNGSFNSNPYSSYYFSDAPLARIINSYSMIQIDANNSGGVAGTNKGIIENTYSTGEIIGFNNAAITNINQIFCYHYQHYVDSAIIKNSYSNIDLNISNINSCYSIWYYGNAVKHFAIEENTLINTSQSYLENNSNPPFNSWDFNNIWKMVNNKPVLYWEE